MTLFELFVPRGALSADQRRRIASRLVTEVISGEGVPDAIIERGRSNTQVVVHEPDAWTVGARPLGAADAPRYIVRVSVPGGHLTDSMRAELVARVTRALAESDPDPQRFYQEPSAWVYVVEVPDGNIGAFGHVMRTSDIIELNVSGEHMSSIIALHAAPAPDTAVDPICGMTVALTDTAITLEQNGTTYAFCNTSCREIFVSQQRAVVHGS